MFVITVAPVVVNPDMDSKKALPNWGQCTVDHVGKRTEYRSKEPSCGNDEKSFLVCQAYLSVDRSE